MDWLPRWLRRGMRPGTLVLLGILVAAFLWTRSRSERRVAPPAPAGAGGAPAAAVAVPSAAERRAEPEAVGPGWGEDPFARRFSAAGEEGTPRADRRVQAGGTPAKATGLYLQGVMSGPLGRTALINGNVVREGERIGNREVLQIGRRSVVLLENGNVVTLSLQGEGR